MRGETTIRDRAEEELELINRSYRISHREE